MQDLKDSSNLGIVAGCDFDRVFELLFESESEFVDYVIIHFEREFGIEFRSPHKKEWHDEYVLDFCKCIVAWLNDNGQNPRYIKAVAFIKHFFCLNNAQRHD